jgi:sugar lactone lactonase YvrE
MKKTDLSRVKTIGSGLARPEGVMAVSGGYLITADARGCCARITPEGKTDFYGNLGGVPNGICMDVHGNCIVANIGNGQVQSLAPDGTHRVLFTHADKKPLPTPNFPFMDLKERLWVSNSTAGDLEQALRHPLPDGSVVLYENNHARIVAEGLYFANGVAVDQDCAFLYVAETTRRAITRFSIKKDGTLASRQTYGPEPLGDLGFPDGCALDEAGNLWITFPAWGAVGYIDPDQKLHIVIEDRRMQVLRRPTNICFGGQDRRTAFIGSLDGQSIPYFQIDSPGQRLIHQP